MVLGILVGSVLGRVAGVALAHTAAVSLGIFAGVVPGIVVLRNTAGVVLGNVVMIQVFARESYLEGCAWRCPGFSAACEDG